MVFVIVDSILIEPNFIQVKSIQIANTGTNMTIVFLADFQRRDADPGFVEKVVKMVNEQNPDLILLGGDYVERDVDELPSIAPLKSLEAKFGVYGVMGNHDYGAFGFAPTVGGNTDLAQKILEFFEISSSKENAIEILRNEKIILGDQITLIGLDDYWAHLRDEKSAYDGPSKGYRILISHNQDDLDIDSDVADLFLFGHTHCGQVRLPMFGSIPKLLGFSGEYDMGHFEVNDVEVYTTCGLTPLPRFLNPPEITLIHLL